jgi:putative IMPACT (imprinted ancient) family translation regulator
VSQIAFKVQHVIPQFRNSVLEKKVKSTMKMMVTYKILNRLKFVVATMIESVVGRV